jgi:hypothetical protein
MTAAPNKSPLAAVIQGGNTADATAAAASRATPALYIEHSVTADMADGQPLPPYTDHGVVWHVVRRIDGLTTWRRLFLSPSASPVTVWRTASGDQARAP